MLAIAISEHALYSEHIPTEHILPLYRVMYYCICTPPPATIIANLAKAKAEIDAAKAPIQQVSVALTFDC